MAQPRFIRRFADLGIEDVPLVGGKNASLGEMYRNLSASGVKVPNGFAITAEAYRHFLEANALTGRIRDELERLDVSDVTRLAAAGGRIRSWMREAVLPADLAEEIAAAYRGLASEYGPDPDVAVRSSATAEDLPDASFAGQQETYLNVRGLEALLERSKHVFASLFTDRAISYREDKGFDHMSVALSIGVQKMVRSDKACSGVMFTLDTESGFRDVVFITSAYGLGENVVQGAVNPDEFYVFKPTLREGFRPILKRQRGEKAIRMVYAHDVAAEHPVRNEAVSEAERLRFSLSDEEVLELARRAVAIEEHYSAKAGQPRPMDIEWAKDGDTDELFIVQARPETVHAVRAGVVEEIYSLRERGPVLARGKSVGHKVAAGRARVILSASRMKELQPGEVLVTDMTDPDWEPVMKIASAIVTNRGGRTCHAAIVARELGIPAVVGSGDATEGVATGTEVTVSCVEGDAGLVYAGRLAFDVETIDYSRLPRPRTRIMLNVGNPDVAFTASALPNDGVGLARLEFIINSSIRVHPRALLEFDGLSPTLRGEVAPIIAGYPGPREFYIERLAEGVATIAAAFYPKPIIVRMSDFKSNEYAALLGGDAYEPVEENPMLGFRGASRYPSVAFADCFAMECAAMRRVREDMGLTNVELMLPFVRTPQEGRRVLDLMAEHGLRRGEGGLKVKLMCEIPANVVLANEFLEHFDGFSIGSNDLTQLTLGIDRDSGLLTGYDERNPAVLRMMEMAIQACRRHGKYVGICGQAPSDFPEVTTWLVEQGIESMSLNPDSVLAMTRTVLEVEARIGAG
jgi:pyruvate,water dikinase